MASGSAFSTLWWVQRCDSKTSKSTTSCEGMGMLQQSLVANFREKGVVGPGGRASWGWEGEHVGCNAISREREAPETTSNLANSTSRLKLHATSGLALSKGRHTVQQTWLKPQRHRHHAPSSGNAHTPHQVWPDSCLQHSSFALPPCHPVSWSLPGSERRGSLPCHCSSGHLVWQQQLLVWGLQHWA